MMVNNNHDFMDRMCPNELQMKIVVNWLGLKLYDRRNDTSFPIVIIPFLCSNTCLRSLNIIMRYFSVFDVFSMFVHVDYFLLLPSVYLSILIYDFFYHGLISSVFLWSNDKPIPFTCVCIKMNIPEIHSLYNSDVFIKVVFKCNIIITVIQWKHTFDMKLLEITFNLCSCDVLLTH